MKNLLALALAVFSFAAVNANVADNDNTNDDVTILPIEEGSEVGDNDGCADCGSAQ